MKKILILLVPILFSITGFCQTKCEKNISISTPTNWVLSGLSPSGTLPGISTTHPGSPYVVSNNASWMTSDEVKSSTHFIFVREINVCKEGYFVIEFKAAADNILNISIDGGAPIFTDNAPGTSAFDTFYTFKKKIRLSCGKHIITADVYNYLSVAGFILEGNISTTDGCLNCECSDVNQASCCKNNFPFWSNIPVPPSEPFDQGTFSIEDFFVHGPNTIPITELKITVEDFQLISKYESCLKCSNSPVLQGSIFGFNQIGTGANQLALQPYVAPISLQTNNNEVIWQNPSGVTLNTNDRITIIYILPPGTDLPCCVDSARVCTRFSYRDINCGYCEVFNCSTIALRSNTTNDDRSGKGKSMGPKTFSELINTNSGQRK